MTSASSIISVSELKAKSDYNLENGKVNAFYSLAREEAANVSDRETASDSVQETSNGMRKGDVVQVTDSIAKLEAEWKLAELSVIDTMETYLGAIGTIKEIDVDDTVRVQWASGNAVWLPVQACQMAHKKAKPSFIYANDTIIFTRFTYGH